jgi:hypothetical protein
MTICQVQLAKVDTPVHPIWHHLEADALCGMQEGRQTPF